jgi:sterol desaturase/sphingolipid hydroxylase (fatty acid hydroxylase superfamily)
VDKNTVRRYTHLRWWFTCLNDAYFVTCCILIKKKRDEKRRKKYLFLLLKCMWCIFIICIISVVLVIIELIWYEKWECQNFVGVHEWANWFCLFLFIYFNFNETCFMYTSICTLHDVYGCMVNREFLLNEFIVLLIFFSHWIN